MKKRNMEKILSWIITLLLVAICIIHHLTIRNYKHIVAHYEKTIAIYESLHDTQPMHTPDYSEKKLLRECYGR